MKRCNPERLQNQIEQFATFGKTPNSGVTRLALSKEDLEARKKLQEICEQTGLTVTYDDMGNMYATLPGQKDLPPIVMGSHVDSVIKGGKFDGILGVLAALEVIQSIVDQGIKLNHPIMLVNFTNEEGARFEPSMMSSGVLAGKLNKWEVLQSTDRKGVTFQEALAQSGYQGEKENRLTEATAYIELHIEQGPVLEHFEQEIGIVEGVLGMVCYEISLFGESNHAGTTPIAMRKDAMFASAHVIVELEHKLKALGSDLVYTIGRMNVYPNVPTVIPNEVTFTLEARHKDASILQQVEEIIDTLSINAEVCTLTSKKLWERATVEFDADVCQAIYKVNKQLGLKGKKMYSGAGHDAQYMAHYIPSAMIFVPSIKGYSHREDEETAYADCANGVNVLLNTVLQLDKKRVNNCSTN